MNDVLIQEGRIRKLLSNETAPFRDHLLRLDADSRQMRFAHAVSDSFVENYAARWRETGAIVHGYFENGAMRAAGELRRLGDTWGTEAEAAFSIERSHQTRGLGTALMGRVIRSARNRGVRRLHMSCLADNSKMQAIARKYAADLSFECGEVFGEIEPDRVTHFSLWAESVEDRCGFILAVMDLQKRFVRAA